MVKVKKKKNLSGKTENENLKLYSVFLVWTMKVCK